MKNKKKHPHLRLWTARALFAPARKGGFSGDFLAFFRAQSLGAGLPSLLSEGDGAGVAGIDGRSGSGIGDLADRNIHYHFTKLIRVARALWFLHGAKHYTMYSYLETARQAGLRPN